MRKAISGRGGAPFVELLIESGGEPRGLGGGDFQAAEFLEDLGEAACGDSLEIHFSDGGLECAFDARQATGEAMLEKEIDGVCGGGIVLRLRHGW